MSLHTFLPRTANTPDEVAIWTPEGQQSWVELEESVRRYANGIAVAGIRPDDKVAILSHNRLEYVQVMLGNLRAGARHVPLNWHLTASEVAYILSDSETQILFYDPEHSEVAHAAAAEAGVSTVICFGDEYDAWLAAQSDFTPENMVAGAPLQYTSGTTGRQKGVVRAGPTGEVANMMELYWLVGHVWGFQKGGVHLVVCPLYHAAPPGQVLFALAHSQSLVVLPRFDAEETLQAIEEHQVTTTHVVPTQIIRMLRLPDEVRSRYNLSSLQGVWHGAAPMPAWAKRDAISWLGPVVIEYFGSSEGTGPLIATSEEWLAHPGTVGKPGPNLEVSVVDEDGNTLPTGEVGTLYFKKPEGPPSYHHAEEKTAESRLPDGRFTVGDVGWLDKDGFVYLADRKIDMIISGGSNIYPSETEAVLSQNPLVADCAVFGVPDEEWGEQVKAAVQLVDSINIDTDLVKVEAELIAFCRQHIAAYKCPRSIDFHPELPREASGKLKKRLLRAPYWPESDSKPTSMGTSTTPGAQIDG